MAAADFGTVLVGWESEELYVIGAQRRAGRVPAHRRRRARRRTSRSPAARAGAASSSRPAAACTVYLVFNPTEPIVFAGTLTVSEVGDEPISVTSSLRGVGGEPTLQANPPGLDLHSSVVNGIGDRRTLDVRNVSFLPTSIASIRLGGNNPDDFAVVGQSCTNRALNPDASCSVEVEFRPRASGPEECAGVAPDTDRRVHVGDRVGRGVVRAADRGRPRRRSRSAACSGIGGSGFPANSGFVLRFADGIRPFAIATTNASGVFLIEIEVPITEGAGERVLIASSPDQVAASTDVLVLRPPSTMPGVPGFGLG